MSDQRFEGGRYGWQRAKRAAWRLLPWIGAALLCSGAASASVTGDLSAGYTHTCAIDAGDGQARCWGWGGNGELGNSRTNTHSFAAPVDVDMSAGALRSIAAGKYFSCGLTLAGAAYCWGSNDSGRLGDGSTATSRATPVPVLGLDSGVLSLALGEAHACALMQGGGVKCWGAAANGRLGTGQTTNQNAPSDVLNVSGAIAIGAGAAHSCALLGDGHVKCWGYNKSGQIGDGTTTDRPLAELVSTHFPVVAISIGGDHNCVLSAGGAAECWGYNRTGQLGDGTDTNRNVPVAVYSLDSGVTQIEAGTRYDTSGSSHTCALTAGRVMKCWGYNAKGQIGDGTTGNFNRPVNVRNLPGGVVGMSLGAGHTCARAGGNAIHCWGRAEHGRLAFGNGGYSGHGGGWPTHITEPASISALPSLPAKLSLLDGTSCALLATGGAMCWGANKYGQIGDGWAFSNGDGVDQAGARAVEGLSSNVRDIAVGIEHVCAVKTDGSVWCWGRNQYGQLGDGSSIQRMTPVQVPGIQNAVAIAAGSNHTCALDGASGVRCWGRNDYGQLGIGSANDSDSPVAVIGIDGEVTALSLGDSHSCALLAGGVVRCWGRNDSGELGDATTSNRYTPVALDDSGTVYTELAAASEHTCGLTDGGQVKCWGRNNYGQLGDGSTTLRVSPVGVSGLDSGVTRIDAKGYFGCALRGTSQMRCWGRNANYQLGDGTATNRNIPVNVANLAGDVAEIALGAASTCVRLDSGRVQCWGYDEGRLGTGYGSNATSWTSPIDVARWNIIDLIFRDGFEH